MLEISLMEDSTSEHVKNLYKAGFTEDQVVALAEFIIWLQNPYRENLEKGEDNNERS